MKGNAKQAFGIAGVVMVCGVLAVGVPLLQAHEGKDGKVSGQQRAEKLGKALNLSDAQKTQVQQITDEYQARREQLKAQNPIKDQLAALREEEDNKIKAVLTPEQQVRFDQWRKDQMAHHKEWKEHHDGDHHNGS